MLKITQDGATCVLTGRLTAQVFALAATLPGRCRWKGRELHFEASRANIEAVAAALPDAEWVSSRYTEVQDLLRVEAAAIPAAGPPADWPGFKTEPRAHQREALDKMNNRKVFGLFLEQGLGKTKIILDDAAWLYCAGEIDTLLIVAPNGVHAQWVDEQVPTHLPIASETLIYRSNQTKRWQKAADAWFASTGKLKVVAMNVEAFVTPKGVAFAEAVLDNGRALWALDESVSIKTISAKRTKQIHKLAPKAPYRRILTGTPITKGVEDLFSQMAFLSTDIFGFSSYYTFRNRYCIVRQVPGAPHGAVKIVGYQNLEELQEKLDRWSFRRTAADCLDLPKRIYVKRRVELTPEQRFIYKQLQKDFRAELDSNETVSVDQVLTMLLRQQQVLCGVVASDEGAAVRLKQTRIQEAVAAAKEATGKVVVWARFKTDIDLLAEAFAKEGFGPVTWDGRTSVKQRAEAKARFINDPTCQAFIANPAAAGTGVDGLQFASHTMIYYSNSFSAVERWQSEARLHRQGQTGTVVVIDLVAAGTVDEIILTNLSAKKDVATSALDLRASLQLTLPE